MMQINKRKFKRNNRYYNALLKIARYYFQEGKINSCITVCHIAASFASSNYCGFYSDFVIEGLLNDLGGKVLQQGNVAPDTNSSGKLKVLHYATELYSVGGHTRLLANWIECDKLNHHDVFIGKQNSKTPEFFTDIVEAKKGKVCTYTNASNTINVINSLYETAKAYDFVVLHHHPNDVIPVIAFSQNNEVPVAVLNHADHLYWIGSSVCDILIEFRDNIIPYDRKRRSIERFSILPIPVALPEQNNYREARTELNINNNEVVLLTIGSEYKYLPFEGKNFFEDIIKILNQCKLTRLFIVGVSAESDIALKYIHPRITYVGANSDIEVYKKCCDIYVEGYPFSSFTAYLEVGALKKPIHFMYDVPLLNMYSLNNYQFKRQYFNTKEEWHEGLVSIINNRTKRLYQGEAMFQDILNNHIAPGWNNYLTELYSAVKNLRHNVREKYKNEFTVTENETYLDQLLSSRPLDDNVLSTVKDIPFVKKINFVLNMYTSVGLNLKETHRDILWFLFKAR